MPRSKSTTHPKTLIIIRHAHRHKLLGKDRDNGLSAKGRRQAEKVLKHYRTVYKGAQPYVVSSPKVRCVETVIPIAKLAGTEVQISGMLDEQGNRETAAAFQRRLRRFVRWWREDGPDLTIACSHGDGIPPLARIACGATIDLAKGGWAEMALEKGEVQVKWVMQHFDGEK